MMGWSTARSKQEKQNRKDLVPSKTALGLATFSIVASDIAWIDTEAARRDIPKSWLVTEIIKLGIASYKAIGDHGYQETLDEYFERKDSGGSTHGG